MMKNNLIKFGKLFFLLVVCLLASCKSSKILTKPSAKQVETNKLISQVLRQQPTFQMAQAGKISATLMYGERRTAVSGSINIITDSAMVLSIQPMLGIELFRIEFNRQKIVVVDKMNRRYVEKDYSEVVEQTGIAVDFETIQALCCNRLFAVGNVNYFQQPNPVCELEKTAAGQQIITFSEKGIQHTFRVSDATCTIDEVCLSPSAQTGSLEVMYANYQITNDVVFPYSITVSAKVGKYDMKCTFDILRLTFNEKANVASADLKRYKQVSIGELMNK